MAGGDESSECAESVVVGGGGGGGGGKYARQVLDAFLEDASRASLDDQHVYITAEEVLTCLAIFFYHPHSYPGQLAWTWIGSRSPGVHFFIFHLLFISAQISPFIALLLFEVNSNPS